MIKNYFKTALRSLWKNRATGSINLFGLSVGMTAAVFIFLWVRNEISVDHDQPGARNIYRITSTIPISKEESWKWENAPMMLAATSLREIPEIKEATRVIINDWGAPVLDIHHNLFSEKTSAWVDKNWFAMFHYDFIAGNPAAFAGDPFSIILTKSKAKKYFGEQNPIGQIIRVNKVNYTVQGVIRDNSANSSFQFDVLLQMDGRLSDPKTYKNDLTWNNFGYTTFLELRPDANIAGVAKKLDGLMDRHRKKNTAKLSLVPLKAMYFEDDLQSSSFPHGNKKSTLIFGLLGVLLLVTACINYVNLTTAKASLRAREVSVRKIVGARRGHLFMQFVAESLVMSMVSLLVTLLLLQLCLPAFNAITEKHFELPTSSVAMWQVLAGTLLGATILNGIYPALLLSSFRPMNVFRGKSVLKLRDGIIRKGLVIFQFSISLILIIASIVIYLQLNFIQSTNPGYNVSQVLSLSIPWEAYSNLSDTARVDFTNAIAHDLQSSSNIEAVSMGSDEIDNVTGSSSGNADWDGRDTTFNPTISKLEVDPAFPKMFGLQLQSGHWFGQGQADIHNYILNQTAVALFKMHQPILGQCFTWGGDTGQVICGVKDFHFKSLHDKIGPMVLTDNPREGGSYIFAKTLPGNIPGALKAARAVWAKFIPDIPFTYNFLDDSFNNLYKTDIRTSQLIFIFSLIAVLISALGLFGLAAFSAEQRTREIGIRKVLGASVQQITALLSKDFVRLVIIAILIASPVAGWAMDHWLRDFAYRIHINAWIFIVAGLLAIGIAILSVGMQAIKAAVANPVKSLRTD